MACSAAPTSAAFVCRLASLVSWLTRYPSQGCWAVWCPCVVYSKAKQRLEHLQNQDTPLPGDAERLDVDCCIYGCLVILGYAWILQVLLSWWLAASGVT